MKKNEPPKEDKPQLWIVIQSQQNPHNYSNSRLRETFEKNGFQVTTISSKDIEIFLTRTNRSSVLINGKFTPIPDLVISRTGSNTDFYTLALYRHLEQLGVPLINKSLNVDVCKNKLWTLQCLAHENLPVPNSLLLSHPIDVKLVIEKIKFPMIIKLISGLSGDDVFLIKTEKELRSFTRMLEVLSPHAEMIFQECITTSIGKDLRVFVIGNKVIGAQKRSNDYDFRANVDGGTRAVYKLTPETTKLAETAAKVIGLDFAGVDLLFDDEYGESFKICEVNSASGFDLNFEQENNVDVPLELLKYAEKNFHIKERFEQRVHDRKKKQQKSNKSSQ